MVLLDVVGLVRALRLLEKKVCVTLMYSGLNVMQYSILTIVDSSSVTTVTELSEKLHVTRATTSTLVNELIKSELLVGRENPNDRRSFHLELTHTGRNKLEVARKDLAVMQKNLSENYREEQVNILNAFASGIRWESIKSI